MVASSDVRKDRELIGMPVYSVEEGRELGAINALLVRRSDSVVAAVGIGVEGAHHGSALPFRKLRTVGIDVVLVDSEETLRQTLTAEEVRELDISLGGRPVITASGEKIGSLMGFVFDTTSGQIEAYRVKPETGLGARLAATLLDRGFEVPVSLVQSVGTSAVIVSDLAAPKSGDTDASSLEPSDAEPHLASETTRFGGLGSQRHSAGTRSHADSRN